MTPRRHLGALVTLALVITVVLAGGVTAWCAGGACQAVGTAARQVQSPSPSPSPTPPWTTLRGLAPDGFRIGSAVDARALASDPAYRGVLTSDFNSLTAENAMKWATLEPARGRYDWSGSDRIVEFAQQHKQSVYGHTLVWHSDVPAWVSADLSPALLRDLLHRHVTSVVSRYRGKVWAWDVVNEVLAEDGTLRDTLWLRRLGPGYIADAFRWAHEADPDAVLFINEYGAEARTKKADALLRLVRDMRSQGVPVNGVGFQSHIPYDKTPVDVAGNLRRFAALGVSIAVTELDVRIKLPVDAGKYARQAAGYRDMLRACLAVPACVSLTVWGFTDSRSWIPGYHRGYGSACIFDVGLNPKPAHTALVLALREHRAVKAGATASGPARA